MFESEFGRDFKNRWVKRSGQELEPHEVFLDSRLSGENRLPELRLELPISQMILRQILFLACLVLLALAAKIFQLSVWQSQNFQALSQKNVSRVTPLRGDRGIIYDRYLTKLVGNTPSFDLVLDKRDLAPLGEERQKEVQILASVLEQPVEAIQEQIDDEGDPVILLAENLGQPTLVSLETKIKDIPGVQIEKNTVRNYVDGPVFSGVLGYLGKINAAEFRELKDKNYFVSDYIGKQGLEKTYEEVLRGRVGVLETLKDSRGKKIQEGVTREPEPGQSLVLWLDADLQKKLQAEMSRVLQEIGVKKGAAVALDPRTGGVLALVSLPSFDNNLFNAGQNNAPSEAPARLQQLLRDGNQPLFNRAVSGRYPAGSSIKPLVASAALQEKIISPEKRIFDNGFIEVPNQYDPSITYFFRGLVPHGWVDMREALAVSSNIYFYTVGGGYQDQKGLGSTRLKKYLEVFGWGQKTGVDLPQEIAGFIPDHNWKESALRESWYVGDTYNLSIGQGYLQVTPLQLADAIAAIANSGQLFKPRLVQKIVTGDRDNFKTVRSFPPELRHQLPIEAANLRVVREGMRQSVLSGSSTILNDLPVKAAAKTGTAQTNKAGYYDNWVTVFAPYDDPQIVLTVLVEDVPGVRAASLLVANETLKWYFGSLEH